MAKPRGFRTLFDLTGPAAALAVVVAWAAPALADGGIPRGYNMLFEPGNPSHVVVRSQYWGLFDGQVSSPNFTLLCSQAYSGQALNADDYPTVVAQGGRILVAAGFGGLNVSDDTCNWKMVDQFNGESVQSIAPMDSTGKSFIVVTVLGMNGGVVSKVYTSSDRGDNWAPVKGTIQMNVSVSGVGVAPSDPKRIYVVGVVINSGPRMIAVSKDGGDTFTMLPVGAMTDYDPTQIAPLSVDGIVPNNPDTLFVRADGGDMAGAMSPDELWVSSDAGMTWKKTYQPMMDLPGFTFTPDGNSVLISGPMEGILQASLADAVAAKSGAFLKIYSGQVWGLAYNDGKLYAGNDDYNMKPSFMVGVSTDNGKTFQKVTGKCDVSFPTCDASSTMQSVCLEQWTRQGGYVTDYLELACGQGAAGAAGATSVGGAGGVAVGASGSVGYGGTTWASSAAGGTPGVVVTPLGGQGGTANDLGGYGGSAMHVGVKSSGCSVGAPGTAGSDQTTWVVAATALGAVVMRRRRKAVQAG